MGGLPRVSRDPGERQVALLRGINVGGHKSIRMEALRELAGSLGCSNAATYIQSGNLVVNYGGDDLAGVLSRGIEDAFGFPVPVVTRTALAFRHAIEACPFPELRGAPKCLHLGFVAEPPTDEAVGSLEPGLRPPDAFEVVGRDIYLATPNGLRDTPYANAYFDRRLGTVTTFRNWRTIMAIAELL